MLFLLPDPPLLRWCIGVQNPFHEGAVNFGPTCHDAILQKIDHPDRIEAIGTLLHNGGEEITETLCSLNPDILERIRRCVPLLPEHNDMTLKTIEFWYRRFPRLQHVLFCDTAFFAGLPPEASTYAVPLSLRKKGIKRYGGYGICHQHAWNAASQHFGSKTRKALSIYLGDSSNIAAVLDGRAVETTVGFTSIEGILSATGCGDIDPTIVLQLYTSGVSYKEINALLTRESGMTGLTGQKCNYEDLLKSDLGSKREDALNLFCYHIIKYCGALISVLGGVDTILFSCENPEVSMGLIERLCNRFSFLGMLVQRHERTNPDFSVLSDHRSRIQVAVLKFRLWDALFEKTNHFDSRNGG